MVCFRYAGILSLFNLFKTLEACSWKHGARCFPGTCTGNMVYNGSCQCAVGFGGTDCETGTKNIICIIIYIHLSEAFCFFLYLLYGNKHLHATSCLVIYVSNNIKIQLNVIYFSKHVL
jgi:hypothetical protein